MTYTTNFCLHKPDANDNFNICDFNTNADIIDNALQNSSGGGIESVCVSVNGVSASSTTTGGVACVSLTNVNACKACCAGYICSINTTSNRISLTGKISNTSSFSQLYTSELMYDANCCALTKVTGGIKILTHGEDCCLNCVTFCGASVITQDVYSLSPTTNATSNLIFHARCNNNGVISDNQMILYGSTGNLQIPNALVSSPVSNVGEWSDINFLVCGYYCDDYMPEGFLECYLMTLCGKNGRLYTHGVVTQFIQNSTFCGEDFSCGEIPRYETWFTFDVRDYDGCVSCVYFDAQNYRSAIHADDLYSDRAFINNVSICCSGNYNEGIRINKASNGYSSLTIGGSGTCGCANAFSLTTCNTSSNPKLYISYSGCSKPNSYFEPNSNCSNAEVLWHGDVNGLASCSYTSYVASYTADCDRPIALLCGQCQYEQAGKSSACQITFNPSNGDFKVCGNVIANNMPRIECGCVYFDCYSINKCPSTPVYWSREYDSNGNIKCSRIWNEYWCRSDACHTIYQYDWYHAFFCAGGYACAIPECVFGCCLGGMIGANGFFGTSYDANAPREPNIVLGFGQSMITQTTMTFSVMNISSYHYKFNGPNFPQCYICSFNITGYPSCMCCHSNCMVMDISFKPIILWR